jgi:hypothetical protein
MLSVKAKCSIYLIKGEPAISYHGERQSVLLVSKKRRTCNMQYDLLKAKCSLYFVKGDLRVLLGIICQKREARDYN